MSDGYLDGTFDGLRVDGLADVGLREIVGFNVGFRVGNIDIVGRVVGSFEGNREGGCDMDGRDDEGLQVGTAEVGRKLFGRRVGNTEGMHVLGF